MSVPPNLQKRYSSLEHRLEVNSVVVDKGMLTPCRIWTGYAQSHESGRCTDGTGYGKINLFRKKRGEKKGKSRKFAVHRIAKILAEIKTRKPDFDFRRRGDKKLFFDVLEAYHLSGLTIDHLCNCSLCINPHHLEWVRMDVNQRRKYWPPSRKKTKERRSVFRSKESVRPSKDVYDLLDELRRRIYRRKI